VKPDRPEKNQHGIIMTTGTMCKVCFLGLLLGISVLGTAGAGILPQGGEAQYELEFWESIKNSTHAEDYEAYLKAYPNGRFAPLARTRAARYAKSPVPAAPPEPPVETMDVQYEAASDVNVREQPSSRAKRVGTLKHGERVHVTGRTRDNNWYRIALAGGGTGYVYHAQLREPAAPPSPAKAPAPAPKPAAPVVASPEKPPAQAPVVAQRGGTFRDCDKCPEMVVVPPGSFVMGDNRGDRSERPAHRVTIGKPYAIGKYEITLAQWNACVQAEVCKAIASPAGTADNSPATNMSWTDAQRYVQWLSKQTGRHYRLPTEAEWEYAARAGTSSRYWWGEKMQAGKANCKDCGGEWSNTAPANVDAFPPNPFGIYGMNGGVWEWVEDCWHKDYDGAPTDGSAWAASDCRENVIRGGSWHLDSTYAHSASRFTYDTQVRYVDNGFRVAKTLP
jgi:formylglycine-generating enzyme required for sulfatase activity